MTKTDLPIWRLYLVPLAATLLAGWFWLSYYDAVRWWPVVLLVIFLANYSWYMAKAKRERD